MNRKNLEIYLNQLAQEIEPLETGKNWFMKIDYLNQKKILLELTWLISQAGGLGKDIPKVVEKSGLKVIYTSCVLLMVAFEKDPLMSSVIRMQMAKIVNLPEFESLKSFILMITFLGISDKRRRETKCLNGCSHWWHKDLSQKSVILDILKEE